MPQVCQNFQWVKISFPAHYIKNNSIKKLALQFESTIIIRHRDIVHQEVGIDPYPNEACPKRLWHPKF